MIVAAKAQVRCVAKAWLHTCASEQVYILRPFGTSTLRCKALLHTCASERNYYNSIDSCKKVSTQIAGMFAEYLHVDSASKLLQVKTTIFKDLQLPTHQLPLIIYASSMNGSSWENAFLFDSLTHAGYVVAAISSVGKFPGFMSGLLIWKNRLMIFCTQ